MPIVLQTTYVRVTRYHPLNPSRDGLFVVLSQSVLAIASMGHVVALPALVHATWPVACWSRATPSRDSYTVPTRVLITRRLTNVSLLAQAVLTGPRPHIFAAVTSSEPKAHGGEFLRRNLARELQAQIGASHGDVLAAFR